MTDRLTIVSWCPNSPCDPCACHWVPNGVTLPRISDPGHPDDGAIDQAATFCGVPFFGLGLISEDPGASSGSIVTGYIDVSFSGAWASLGIVSGPTSPPVLPPPILVNYEGGVIYSLGPIGSYLSFYSTSGDSHLIGPDPVTLGPSYSAGIWSCACRCEFSAIMLGDKDQKVGTLNCVAPFTGPIPDPVFGITPSTLGTSLNPSTIFGYAGLELPGFPVWEVQEAALESDLTFYLHVAKSIDPV